MHLILASPDSGLRERYGDWLRRHDHTPLDCSHGIQALAAWERHAVPMIVCELTMPLYSGIEVGLRIRALDRPRYTYIVLLHRQAEAPAVLDDAYVHGIDAVLPREGAPEALRPHLNLALRLAALQTHVNQLEAMLTMCVYCRAVSEGEETWQPVDAYLQEHTGTLISHGICPVCLEEQHRQLAVMRAKMVTQATAPVPRRR